MTFPARAGIGPVLGMTMSLVLHALLLWATGLSHHVRTERPTGEPAMVRLKLLPPEPESPRTAARPERRTEAPLRPAPTIPSIQPPMSTPAAAPETPRTLATMAAPPPPTADEWAFAGRYTLKNSKAYRHTWGQQVRSMMGTAVEGPGQGMVRFRVEIAPDGSLASLETLWSTSPVAERLARQAIAGMPRGPATPTGKPLIFERTIAFTPFAVDGPPLYKDDCLPDPPSFSNPFAWDGRSAQEPVQAKPSDKPDPQALEDCLRQLPQDSIEAEMARDQRLMDQWGWGSSAPGR
jgi:hypothetical protein